MCSSLLFVVVFSEMFDSDCLCSGFIFSFLNQPKTSQFDQNIITIPINNVEIFNILIFFLFLQRFEKTVLYKSLYLIPFLFWDFSLE